MELLFFSRLKPTAPHEGGARDFGNGGGTIAQLLDPLVPVLGPVLASPDPAEWAINILMSAAAHVPPLKPV